MPDTITIGERSYRIRLHGDPETSILLVKAWDIRHCDNGDIEVIGHDGGIVAGFSAGTWKWFALTDFKAEVGTHALKAA